MLENWCWLGQELKHLSCHYTALDPVLLQEWRTQHPGEADPPVEVPDALIEPLIQNRHAFICVVNCESSLQPPDIYFLETFTSPKE